MFDRLGSSLERYMDLVSARQKLVASNIANSDTPGFRTRDLDFQAEFQGALDSHGLKKKNDGNNVSIDREARLLSENALRFNLAAQLMKSHVKDIRNAIQEGRAG
jgi:flagellar basal-body rod protein FlgB